MNAGVLLAKIDGTVTPLSEQGTRATEEIDMDLTQAAQNAVIEMQNIHRDMLARSQHAPTGCPCTTTPQVEACPLAVAIQDLRDALMKRASP